MTKQITILILAALAVTALRGQNAATNAPGTTVNLDEPVARVGNTVIPRRELNMAVGGLIAQMQRQGRMVPPQFQSQLEYDVLDGLVEREVVLQFAKANPPADLDAKIKAQIERIRAMAGGEEPLLKSLQEAGVSQAEFERRTRENVIVSEALQQVAEAQVKVPSEEVKAFFDSNVARFKQPELVRASHILVRVEPSATNEMKKAAHTKINAARSLVLGGEKFADIARKVSDDTGSARNGGDLGYFQRNRMVPEFDKVAFSLPTNQVSEVITTQFGYHVLLVTDHKPEKQLGFDEVKADIERLLRSRKGGDVVREYVKGLREKAKIEILLPRPPPPPTDAMSPANMMPFPMPSTNTMRPPNIMMPLPTNAPSPSPPKP